MKKRALLGVTLLTFTTLAGCTNLSEQKAAKNKQRLLKRRQLNLKSTSKNVIFMIGDGMGNPYTTGYRYFKANHSDKRVPQTAFDTYLVGQQATYPEDEENVTDSASAATAMAAGVKPIIMLLHSIMTSPKQKQCWNVRKSGEINGSCSNI